MRQPSSSGWIALLVILGCVGEAPYLIAALFDAKGIPMGQSIEAPMMWAATVALVLALTGGNAYIAGSWASLPRDGRGGILALWGVILLGIAWLVAIHLTSRDLGAETSVGDVIADFGDHWYLVLHYALVPLLLEGALAGVIVTHARVMAVQQEEEDAQLQVENLSLENARLEAEVHALRTGKRDADKEIADALSGAPQTVKEIALACDLSTTRVREGAARLVEDGRAQTEPGEARPRHYWR